MLVYMAEQDGPRERATAVVVVDDHRVVREGLRSLLEAEPGMAVVAEASSADEALAVARRHRPDVVVVDNKMPGGDGLALLPALRAELPAARLVMFSLDGSIERAAIAAGADAFVAKDAAMQEIIDAIRPGAVRREPGLSGAPLPTFPRTAELRRAALVLAVVLVAYAALFLLVESVVGASAGVFSTLAVFVAGLLLGPEAGLLAAVLTMGLTLVLWLSTGHVVGEPILQIGFPGAGLVVLIVLGAAAGTLRTMGLRFEPRARRVEAVAEAARSLSGQEPSALVDVYLRALLRTVSGEVALLVTNGGGDGRVLASSVDAGRVDERAAVRLAWSASGRARVVPELRPDERPVPNVRSAIVVPVAHGDGAPRGMVVALARRSARYGLDDVERVRMFADYLWLLLDAAVREPAASRPSRRASPA